MPLGPSAPRQNHRPVGLLAQDMRHMDPFAEARIHHKTIVMALHRAVPKDEQPPGADTVVEVYASDVIAWRRAPSPALTVSLP